MWKVGQSDFPRILLGGVSLQSTSWSEGDHDINQTGVNDMNGQKIEQSNATDPVSYVDGLEQFSHGDVLESQTLLDNFKASLNGVSSVGISAMNSRESWESTAKVVFGRIFKVYFSFIHEKHSEEDTKEMVKWLYRSAATGGLKALIASVDKNQINDEKVIRHLVAYAFLNEESRKKTDQHEKIKNLKLIGVKLLRDPEVQPKTDIAGKMFPNGIEAYRTKSAGSKGRKEARDNKLKVAVNRLKKAASYFSVKNDVWAKYAKQDAANFEDHVGEYVVVIGDINSIGDIDIRAVMLKKHDESESDNTVAIEQALISWGEMHKQKEEGL